MTYFSAKAMDIEKAERLMDNKAAAEKWAGIDDDLQEKNEGSGAIYDDATGDFLFRVPPQYRVLIVNAVNAYSDRVALMAQERRRVWGEAIKIASQFGSASRHAWGDGDNPSLMDMLLAAAAAEGEK